MNLIQSSLRTEDSDEVFVTLIPSAHFKLFLKISIPIIQIQTLFVDVKIKEIIMKREREEHDLEEYEQPEHKEVKMGRLMPKKADYRMRAHINPLSSTTFPYPPHHTYVDWKAHYPLKFGASKKENEEITCNTVEHPSNYQQPRKYSLENKKVTIIDIGCGFGGLLFGLAPLFPQELLLGLEIRDKLVNYVGQKIRGSRISEEGKFDHISVVRTNTMRHLCQYFPRGSLKKIFICFPDPHFKAKNHRRRIINTGFLSEYAYLLQPKGRLYCITDVLDLHEWHINHLQNHNMFTEIKDPEDPCIKVMVNKTEEGQKVERNQGEKYWAIFEKK